MLTSPLILFALLLFGLALSYFIAARWPGAVYHSAVAMLGISLLLWLGLGRQLPLTSFPFDTTADAYLLAWQWQVDKIIWLLSGVLLLLLFSLLLYRAGRAQKPPRRNNHHNWQLRHCEWQPILMLALVAAGLSAIWAATLATFMTSWTLFVVLWALYHLTTGDHPPAVTQRMFWMLVPLLFAGFAAAIKPVGSNLLDMSGWSQAAIIAIALTTMSQMGIMPFIGWRPRTDNWQPADGPVLFLLPPLIGAGLLVRLVTTAHIESATILILTLFALGTILAGLRYSWAHLRSSARLPADLALSLSGLAFLTAIWTGTLSLLAGIQLLVFASTTLFLLENLPISRIHWWRAIGPSLALLAVAAFPFTAGFISLNSLYTVWLTNNFLLLTLALLLLLIPLLTAVFIFVHDHVATNPTAGRRHPSAVTEIAQLMPATGLIMLGGFTWSDTHWATWLILLVTVGGALLLARYVGEVQDAIISVDTALSPEKLPFANAGTTIQKFFRQVLLSVGEAAYILEGDRGLLWLTAFLAVLLLAVSG